MQKWWGGEGCQNASAADPDNMWSSNDSRQPKRFTDILFLKNISGLYEPQLSAYKFSPLIPHPKNQTYSLTNIHECICHSVQFIILWQIKPDICPGFHCIWPEGLIAIVHIYMTRRSIVIVNMTHRSHCHCIHIYDLKVHWHCIYDP